MSAYIDSHKNRFGVEPICRALQVAPSTYYARRVRPPSARAQRDAELIEAIHAARAGYRRVYGVRKTWRELSRAGVQVGRDRIARLMRVHGLEGVRRGRKVRTTTPAGAAAQAPADLVGRRFVAEAPNRLWLADITYLRTFSGFAHLAFILDVFARRIVGWQLAAHPRTELVMDALEMAVALRRPEPGLVAHSDRGCQYTSLRYTDRLHQLGIAPSVGSAGDAHDNAMAEAWVATFKSELVAGHLFPSFEHAEHATLRWIAFYNSERLHEELGDVPPDEFEDRRAPIADHPHGPCGPVEADRPALRGGAPAGLVTQSNLMS